MRLGLLGLICGFVSVCGLHVAFATQARADALTLRTGEELHGRIVEAGASIVLDHEVLGRITLARDDVATIQRAAPVGMTVLPQAIAPQVAAPAPVLTQTAAPLTTPSLTSPSLRAPPLRLSGAASDKGPWSHTAGLSSNLAQGNTDVFSIEGDFKSRYERGVWAFEVGGLAIYTRTEGTTSTEHYHAHARVERKLDKRTYIFGQVLFDRDEIADLEYRVNGTIGLGRVLAKTSVAELRGEIGVGMTHEKRLNMGSTTDPSGWVALDYERNWADGSKLTAEFDFLPNFGNFDLSVATFDAEYAKAMTEGMSLFFGLRFEYVIDPPNAKSLDTYFRAGIRFDF